MTGFLEQPEGATPLTIDELQGLKHGTVTTHGELNELEAINIEQGIRWLDKQSKKKTFNLLDDSTAREIHERLFGHVWTWAGTYRKTEKNIGVLPYLVSTDLRSCLDDTTYWIKDSVYSPAEAVARFHHRLVFIHPFPNGNGRWSRIMGDELLRIIDRDLIINWSNGGDLQSESEHRKLYINALQAADGYDFEPLIEFVENAIL
jgi:Fic-DOC domain mobile mystery protein B